MKHSIDELFEIVYRYYPRGPLGEDQSLAETEENRLLVAARHRAGADYEPWRAMHERLRAQFPDCKVEDRAFHLPSGSFDACYSARLVLPTLAPEVGQHAIGFLVSILVPYYTLYRSRWFYIPGTAPEPVPGDPPPQNRSTPREISFDFTEDEQPYARGLAAEIEATFGYEWMPTEIGKTVVPEACTRQQLYGESTIFDCLITDDW